MQAIARVNRVFRDKPGGLVVDYLGIAPELKKALAIYTESGGKGSVFLDQSEAVATMLEKYEVCCSLFHGFNWSTWKNGFCFHSTPFDTTSSGTYTCSGEMAKKGILRQLLNYLKHLL